MSRHYFDTEHAGSRIRITLGYDRPLDEFFLQVERLPHASQQFHRDDAESESPYLYASIDDPDATTDDLEFYRQKLAELGLSFPESLFLAVAEDGAERAGNYVVEHSADGRTRVIHEESRPRHD